MKDKIINFFNFERMYWINQVMFVVNIIISIASGYWFYALLWALCCYYCYTIRTQRQLLDQFSKFTKEQNEAYNDLWSKYLHQVSQNLKTKSNAN